MKKLANRGISHLLVPVLAFMLVAGLGGAYFLANSHAATTTSSSSTTETGTVAEPTGGGPDAADMATLAANEKAFAAAQTKSSSSGPKMCLYYDNRLCVVTHGNGNQVTISNDSNAWAQWSWFADGDTLEFQNFSGNCLRNNGDRTVTMENHGCDGEDGERWYVTTNQAPYHFKSYKFYNNNWFMATYGNVNGWNVWDLTYGTKNYWRSWGIYN